MKSLKNDNKTFKDEVSLLNTATKVNYNDDINTNPTLIQCENSVVDSTKVANPDAAANNSPNITLPKTLTPKLPTLKFRTMEMLPIMTNMTLSCYVTRPGIS
jgi:hypothetical protein